MPAGHAAAEAIILTCLVLHANLYALWFFMRGNPAFIRNVFAEDRIVEWATALVFLGAAAAALWGLFAQRRSAPLKRQLALGLIGSIGLLGFLDELSFGERLFDLPPFLIAGVKIDGAHDLIDLLNTLRRDMLGSMPGAVKAIVGLAAVAAAAAGLCLVHRFRAVLFDARALPAFYLGMLLVGELTIATLIDIGTINFRGAHGPVEEVAELNAAIATLGLAYVLGWASAAQTAAEATQGRGVAPHLRRDRP